MRASAAEAGMENEPVLAAVNRCATQNRMTQEFFSEPGSSRAFQEMAHNENWELPLEFFEEFAA